MLSVVLLNHTALGSTCSSCDPGHALVTLSTAAVLIAEAILILRVYAVYYNNMIILGLLSSVWIAHLALMSCVLVGGRMGGSSMDSPYVISKKSGVLYIFPAIVFDTIAGAFLTVGLYRRSGSYRTTMPLTRLIIQDGLLYFAVVFVTNVCWILVHVLEVDTKGNYDVEFMPLEIWSACITTTMIGRLTLNLRMYDPQANNELTFQTMSIRFQSSRPPNHDSNEERG